MVVDCPGGGGGIVGVANVGGGQMSGGGGDGNVGHDKISDQSIVIVKTYISYSFCIFNFQWHFITWTSFDLI